MNHYVFSRPEGAAQVEGWSTSWLIFAGYALVVAVLFLFFFHEKDVKPGNKAVDEAERAAASDDAI